jgi:alpha-1,3-mannosyltransferase
MRVLQVCHHFHPCIGGVEKYVEGLCRHLSRLGHQSDVVCLDTCAYSEEKLPDRQEYGGIKIYRIPYTNLRIYKVALGLWKFIKGYDVIHIHGLGFFSDFMALTKFIHRKPLVLSGHGGIFHTKSYSLLKKTYFYLWSRAVLKAYTVLVHSKNDEDLFSKITECVYIPYSTELRDFLKVERRVEKNTLLYIGRISRNKRIDNLIKMVSFLKKKIPYVKLYVVGSDWEGIKGELKDMVKEKGLWENVIFTGESEMRELLRYLAKAEIFVSASEYEAFGISVVEAMAAGVPVVVNDIDSFRNIVENGKNGFILDYSNPEEASNHIYRIMNKDLGQISERAKKTAEEYGWEKTIRRIEEAYIRILEEKT